MRFYYSLIAIITWVAIATHGTKLCDKKCYPGQKCFPSDQEIATFASDLDGSFIYASDPRYAKLNTMKNGRVKRQPALIIFAESVDDVKESVRFGNQHHLRVTILSSGHEYIGRSAHHGSLLINLSNMTNINVRTDLTARSPGGEVTVQSGNAWARVYEEVDKYNRIVVGGSAHTVTMGGYTQGGGHSPMSRSLGLAVDNLLEVQMVTAEGHLIMANADGITNMDTGMSKPDKDLFWALRGGGGGTWGVVVSFTFKIHVPPTGFVHFSSFYPLVYYNTTPGLPIMEYLVKELGKLPRQWGGYIIMNTNPSPDVPGAVGSIGLSLLHYGSWNSPSMAAIQPLFTDRYNYSVYKAFRNHTSFWNYEKNVGDADVSALRAYIVNSLIPPHVDAGKLSRVIIEESFAGIQPGVTGSGGTFTLIGGKMQDVDYSKTPINPGFRDALFSVSIGRIWSDPKTDMYHIDHAKRFNSRLTELGNGVYFNEPAEDLDNWKTEYWGNNYYKLLEIKQKWDPKNFFCCHNCVGSDLDDGDVCTWLFPPSSSNRVMPMSQLIAVIVFLFMYGVL